MLSDVSYQDLGNPEAYFRVGTLPEITLRPNFDRSGRRDVAFYFWLRFFYDERGNKKELPVPPFKAVKVYEMLIDCCLPGGSAWDGVARVGPIFDPRVSKISRRKVAFSGATVLLWGPPPTSSNAGRGGGAWAMCSP